MEHDDVRRKILARRTCFVVAALASAGITTGASGCCDRGEGFGEPCLTIAEPMPDGSAHEPAVCLKIAPDSTEEGEEPKVCLTAPMPSSKPPTPG